MVCMFEPPTRPASAWWLTECPSDPAEHPPNDGEDHEQNHAVDYAAENADAMVSANERAEGGEDDADQDHAPVVV